MAFLLTTLAIVACSFCVCRLAAAVIDYVTGAEVVLDDE